MKTLSKISDLEHLFRSPKYSSQATGIYEASSRAAHEIKLRNTVAAQSQLRLEIIINKYMGEAVNEALAPFMAHANTEVRRAANLIAASLLERDTYQEIISNG